MTGRLIFASALLGFAGTYAIARGPQQGQPGMSGMGMMAAMRDPLDQATMTAFLLPELQSELSLSTQQVTQLKQFKQELLTKGRELSNQVSAKQSNWMLCLLRAPPKRRRSRNSLKRLPTLAQQQYAGYEAAGKMKGVLTEQQRTRLAALKPAEIHQAMMAHMTIGDMTQMMQLMGIDGMMPGHMMGMMGMMGSSQQR